MAVHLGFAKKSSRLEISQTPMGKIGGEPLWFQKNFQAICCGVNSNFICQIFAPGEEDQAYYRYLYVFQCPSCRLPLAFRDQLRKNSEFFAEPEERKAEDECDDWNTETNTETLINLLEKPESTVVLSDLTLEVYEEDPAATHVINKLFGVDLGNNMATEELYELMEGGDESAGEEKISQEEDDDDDDLEEIAEGNRDKDVSFDVFKWHSSFTAKCPVIRYCRNSCPLWYSDKERPQFNPGACRCGAIRNFEFQVLPQIIPAIGNLELDFGSIYVFTCPAHCEINEIVQEESFYQPSL